MQKLDAGYGRGSLLHLPRTRAPEGGPRLHRNSQKTFSSRSKAKSFGLSIDGDGTQRLKTRLISHGLPESTVNELIDHHTPLNYPKGSMIFLQGAPTDILYWVSGGLVDIICPDPEGGQIQTSLLGSGDFFGFVEFSDSRGNRVQAFQSRARTHVQVGLITRDRVSKVLSRLDPPLLVHVLAEITAVWGSFTHYCTQFLGMNYGERLETVLRDLAQKFGVSESRGTLLIHDFTHTDLAEMIGCSRPMVSRLIAEMIANKRLVYDGKHYIVLDDLAISPTES